MPDTTKIHHRIPTRLKERAQSAVEASDRYKNLTQLVQDALVDKLEQIEKTGARHPKSEPR